MSQKTKTKNKSTILTNCKLIGYIMSLIKLPSIDEWIMKM